jgi:hypothetical protein
MAHKTFKKNPAPGGTELFEQSRYTPKNHSVAKLLAEYSSKYMPVFEKVKSQWNPVIREFYRGAMGLRLYSGTKGRKAMGDAGVPIQIRPDRDDTFLKAVDDMLPNVDFERYAALRVLRDALLRTSAHFTEDPERKRIHDWMLADIRSYLASNSLAGPFTEMMNKPGKHRSLFGLYTYSDQHIELFYMPLLIFCKYNEVDLQWAIVVVLAHELAHAYHHAGKDNDGRAWANMPKAHLWIKEGLAEYFTERFVMAHEREYPALRMVYDRLLQGSGEEYTSYLAWEKDHSLEHVKLALSMVRRHDVRTYEAFKAKLAEAKRLMN